MTLETKTTTLAILAVGVVRGTLRTYLVQIAPLVLLSATRDWQVIE